MREEVAAAVVFITRMVKKNENISKDKAEEFSNQLSAVLVEKFKNHWYDDTPHKGQAYRCIRVNETEPIDPVLEKAAKNAGLKYKDLKMPPELTLWVDPHEVCCRFGEAKGSYCTVASFQKGSMDHKAHKINIDSAVERARQLKQNEEQKIITRKLHKNQEVKNIPTNKVKVMVKNTHNKVQLNNSVNYQQQKKYVNARPFTSRMTPFAPPFYVGDNYHWVRGADLVKA